MALTAAREGRVSEQEHGGVGEERRREHMFDKVVTPSDVGKLNRLVVPKNLAERYFLPRLLGGGGPAAARLAGVVLRFEDGRGSGRAWAFRFSYWRSSQSYVMTKGWSSFVRDRRLAAGDTVSFCRAGARFFIDCRRRGEISAPATPVTQAPSRETRRLVTSTASCLDVGAPRGRCLRLFGVDVELAGAEPLLLLDLQLALMR
ncbi:unnamed protein product [Alopecurus aequalis]